MNWKTLTKDQKQKAALAVIIVIVAVLATKQFVLTPFLMRQAERRQQLSELKEQIELADKAIKGEAALLGRLSNLTARLEVAQRERIAAQENPLAWATRTIYGHARAAGIDIETVADQDMDTMPFMAKDQARRSFRPYAVRIVTQCSYAQLQQLVAALEGSNPHLCVAGISVGVQPNSPEKHQVGITVEWPGWKDPAQARAAAGELPVPAPAKEKPHAGA